MAMGRIKLLWFGGGLAIAWAASLASLRVGSADAYDRLGNLPVQYRGRVAPLSSMAIDAVNLIYGRSTILLLDPNGKTTSSWEPVAALLDWSARPEFWDNQEFIFVEDLPIRRLILGAWVRAQVRWLAGKVRARSRNVARGAGRAARADSGRPAQAAHQVGEASATGKRLERPGRQARRESPMARAARAR